MRVNTFDRYEERASPIHRLDPRVKVVVTVLFIVSNVLLPDGAWWAFLLAYGLLLLLNRLAQFRFSYLFKRSFIALPFALAAVTVLFTLPGNAVAICSLGSLNLTVSDVGLVRFASILLRSWLSVQAAILLTAVTQFPDLMHALHHLRVPALLVAIISFMYRYLFVLADEAIRLLRARESRSARPAAGGRLGGTVWWRARVTGNMVGQLFVRSYERSERVYSAMLARGYRGQLLVMHPHRIARTDWGATAVFLLALLFIQVVGWLG